jgi:alkanesulfonate monooxygenase SsuD/methylene tetrahydromethanopterin reductase-like flavin-dependent oxidoreductase (luciferase family)
MRFAVNIAPFAELADAGLVATLAHETESAGWDGFFLWDHMNWDRWGPEIGDPWICLTAAAAATSTVRLGTMVTPVFRRRPTTLARQTTTLHNFSAGRVVLGVGLGAPDPEESMFLGEESRLKQRASITDEALQLLQLLWSGKPVAFRGEHFKVKSKGFQPVPVTPIPIWVAATHPWAAGPLRRAARHQGLVPACYDADPLEAAALAQLRAHLPPSAELVYGAYSGHDAQLDAERVAAYREAGVTWWLEPLNPWRASFAELRARLRAGPPR